MSITLAKRKTAAGLTSAQCRPIVIYTLRSARIFHRWRYARSENSPEHRLHDVLPLSDDGGPAQDVRRLQGQEGGPAPEARLLELQICYGRPSPRHVGPPPRAQGHLRHPDEGEAGGAPLVADSPPPLPKFKSLLGLPPLSTGFVLLAPHTY